MELSIEALRRNFADAAAAGAQQIPELVQVVGAGQTAGHADDRQGRVFHSVSASYWHNLAESHANGLLLSG